MAKINRDRNISLKFAEEYAWCEKYISRKDWATKYNVSVTSIRNWKVEHSELIKNIMEQRSKEIIISASQSVERAINRLDKQLDNKDQRIAQGAAKILIDKTIIAEQIINVKEAEKPMDLSKLSREELDQLEKIQSKIIGTDNGGQ